MRLLLLLLLAFTLSGCVFRIDTPYGNASSDGKTITVTADTRGFAK